VNTRWPKLGGVIEKLQQYGVPRGVHYALDWVEGYTYTRERLLEIAKDMSRAAPIPTADGNGVWNNAIEILLQALADNKGALEALNHRKPTMPARFVSLNRAVHVYVLLALRPAKSRRSAYMEVGKVWGRQYTMVEEDVGANTLKDDTPDSRPVLRAGVWHGVWHAPYLMEEILRTACRSTPAYKDIIPAYHGIQRRQALLALDSDLRVRASTIRAVKSRKKQARFFRER
jgi:hypothetical protein